jgi:HK97 family phage portal protein
MNLFSPILRLFGLGSLSNPDKGYQVGAVQRTGTSSGVSVSDERALQVSAVWACTQLITNSVASMPLEFFRKDGDGRRALGKHYLTDLFYKSPNALMKPRDFRMAMTTQMCLWANAYAEIVRIGDRPVALMPLRPGRMTPFLDAEGHLTYHYSVENGVKVYDKRSILHLKGFGTDGIVGAERNNFAREAYGLTVAAETFAAKQFANGGRPGGVITFDTFLNDVQRKQAKQLYEGISEGAHNANELWVLEGGSKYDALDFAADQMQMLGTRMQQLAEIARFFGVPEVMIGAGSNTSSAWPASFEQQILYFLNFTLQGYIDEWECAISDALIPTTQQAEIFADHDVSTFIKMDSTSKANYLSKLVQNGLATRNEARRRLNLPRVDGGDELTVQTNLSNLEDLEAINGNQADGQNTGNQAGQPVGAMPTEIRQ